MQMADARGGSGLTAHDWPACNAKRTQIELAIVSPPTRELLFRSAEDAARLSHIRYTDGVTGHPEVLTNEPDAFSAELGPVQARPNELLAPVQLYQALGGGWQQ
jgi:hypothetical protein